MLNPASHIIALLGGPQATAELAGVHISRVFRWTYPKARGGTGGLVPAQHQQHHRSNRPTSFAGLPVRKTDWRTRPVENIPLIQNTLR